MARGFIKYSAYPFQDRDPVLDLIWAIKRNKKLKNSKITEAGGPTVSTLRQWEPDGKVRRPQFATVAATCSAMGMTSVPITSDGRRELKNKFK